MSNKKKERRNRKYIHKLFDGKNLVIITTKDKDLKIKQYGRKK